MTEAAITGALRVDQVGKRYGDTEAVQNLSFAVQSGQVMGLIGPNGSGKTTTLRIIAGLIDSSGGRVELAGCDVRRQPMRAKRVLGFVGHEPQLFPSLTVGEHLELTRQLYQVGRDTTFEDELLERFGLADRRQQVADALSRGLQQKTAIVCALMIKPRVLLLDEPLNSLDPAGTRTALEETRKAAKRGAAVLISSHLLDHVERVCDGFVLLANGKKVAEGDLSSLAERFPDTPEGRRLEALFFGGPHAGAAG